MGPGLNLPGSPVHQPRIPRYRDSVPRAQGLGGHPGKTPIPFSGRGPVPTENPNPAPSVPRSSAMRPQRLQHPSPGGSLAWLLLLLVLPGAAAQGSFEVRASPEPPMVEHGGSVRINCSHTCSDPGARGGLETSLTKTDDKSGPGWKAFLLTDIQEWTPTLKCHFTCNGQLREMDVNMLVYRAPERVVLEPIPELELGRAYHLTCRVLNVAPVGNLTVTLRQGGQTLRTETFQNHTGTGPNNVTVTHEITPRRRDHGQEITCHSALDLTLHGKLFQNSSPAVQLREAEIPTAKIIAISAIATVPALLLGILAWELAGRGRTRQEARPEPGGAAPSRTGFELAQASEEDAPAEGESLNSAEEAFL